MKSIIKCILLVCLPFFLLSCETVTENYLEGKWLISDIEILQITDYEVYWYNDEIGYDFYITFDSNFTFESNLFGNGRYSFHSNNDFVVLEPDKVDYVINCDVRKIGVNKIELFNTLKSNNSENIWHTQETTYRLIKLH